MTYRPTTDREEGLSLSEEEISALRELKDSDLPCAEIAAELLDLVASHQDNKGK